jgi:hypothetical protein
MPLLTKLKPVPAEDETLYAFFDKPLSMQKRDYITPQNSTHTDALTSLSRPEAEQAVKDFIAREMAAAPPCDVNTRLRDRNSQWRAMSAFQKAIRRDNPLIASRAVRAMVDAGLGATVWRRLATITLEDTGPDNLLLCAAVNLLGANKALRDSYDPIEVAVWAARALCKGAKTRDLCHLEVFNGQKTNGLTDTALSMQACSDNEAIDYALGKGTPTEQYLAQWSFGTRPKDTSFGIPSDPRPAGARAMFWDAIKFPHILRCIVEWHTKAVGAGLTTMLPYFWASICEGGTWSAPDFFGELSPSPIIAGLPACTFDKHTREGKTALGRFARAYGPFSKLCAEHKVDGYEFASALAFYAEGAMVNDRLWSPTTKNLMLMLFTARFGGVGVSLPLLYKGVECFNDQLPALNKFRSSAAGE